MTVDANKVAARSYFEAVINRGDMSEADRIFAPHIQFSYPLGNLSGAKEVKKYLEAVRSAFPDICFAVEDLVCEQDRVSVRWTLTGTQSGEFKGKAPTNRGVSVSGLTMFRCNDGLIEEMWIAFDPARLMGS